MRKYNKISIYLFSIMILSIGSAGAHTDVSPETAQSLIQNNDKLLVIDVREPDEFCSDTGHIPCAVNYPWNSGVLMAQYEEIPKDKDILLVCRSGRRSNLAANFLDEQGFPSVYDIGGMNAWAWETLTCNQKCPNLIFSHIIQDEQWETDIAVINTDGEISIGGILRAYDSQGNAYPDTLEFSLEPYEKQTFNVKRAFPNVRPIAYVIFEADYETVVGFAKFYQKGQSRGAVPAMSAKQSHPRLYLSHIASDTQWRTELSLLNSNPEDTTLTLQFDNGASKNLELEAHGHRRFLIRELFEGIERPDIHSAYIENAAGIIGIQLFVAKDLISGIALTGPSETALYYPHIASDGYWWTGVVAANASQNSALLTITPFASDGTAFASQYLPLAPHEKYIGEIQGLGFPPEASWFQVQSTEPVSGLNLFGTWQGGQLGGFSAVGTDKAEGIFPHMEAEGWTGIVFVNPHDQTAELSLEAYREDGSLVASQNFSLAPYEKRVQMASAFFSKEISKAAYLRYRSDQNLTGFQLNGSADDLLLDGLPVLGK